MTYNPAIAQSTSVFMEKNNKKCQQLRRGCLFLLTKEGIFRIQLNLLMSDFVFATKSINNPYIWEVGSGQNHNKIVYKVDDVRKIKDNYKKFKENQQGGLQVKL